MVRAGPISISQIYANLSVAQLSRAAGAIGIELALDTCVVEPVLETGAAFVEEVGP
jgi:hypothetical protein